MRSQIPRAPSETYFDARKKSERLKLMEKIVTSRSNTWKCSSIYKWRYGSPSL